MLDKFTYNCNFLILIPLLKYDQDPFIFNEDKNIKIIYFKSNLKGRSVDIDKHIEEWSKLKILINKLYNFNVKERNENI